MVINTGKGQKPTNKTIYTGTLKKALFKRRNYCCRAVFNSKIKLFPGGNISVLPKLQPRPAKKITNTRGDPHPFHGYGRTLFPLCHRRGGLLGKPC